MANMVDFRVLHFYFYLFFFFHSIYPSSLANSSKISKPHVIMIIADDMGWNDVGFHGSNQIPTPNIDALAYNGIILNKHYVLPTCTPSRASLMTGKYPIRTGLQGDPGSPSEPWALPIEEILLPQRLKACGYKTHLVGKWHLGFYQSKFTPTQRGFDSHFGYFNGVITYNNSTTGSSEMNGYDARRNLEKAANEFKDQYATDVFTDEAVNIIKSHDANSALFLELSHLAVHAVKGDILQVRNETENDKEFSYIEDKKRRLFAGMLHALDKSVGRVMTALDEANLLDNSVVLFLSDNGGATLDPEWQFENTASNWPLRGMKTSLYDGGVRGVATVWSHLFKKKNYVSHKLFHISDWLPTFVAAAGGDVSELKTLDGVNQWNLLTGEAEEEKRNEILININRERNHSAFISDNWKYIRNNRNGSVFADNYAGIAGRENYTYSMENVLHSPTHSVISKRTNSNNNETATLFYKIREAATIDRNCSQRISRGENPKAEFCQDCLYDLENDPCEFVNIADRELNKVKELKIKLNAFEKFEVPQIRRKTDENANPKYWDNYWSPWLDEKSSSTSSALAYGTVVLIVAFSLGKGLSRQLFYVFF